MASDSFYTPALLHFGFMVYQYTLSFPKYYGSSYAASWAVCLLDSADAKGQEAASAQLYLMWGPGLHDPSAQVEEHK